MHAQRSFDCYLSEIGGLCGGSRLAALKEGSRLASVQEHLHGVVCDGSHLWSDQCCYHGYLRPRHPVSIQLHPKQGEEKKTLRRAPGEKGVKFEGQNISLTSGQQLYKKKEKKKKKLERVR